MTPPPAQLQFSAPPPVEASAMQEEVLAGLSKPRKSLPCKYFYDDRGSRLFERICRLPEYYLTRTELAIMARHRCEIVRCLGPECLLIEYGSGSSRKTRLLLDVLERPAAYMPIDISRGHLLSSAAELRSDYPQIQILPVCGDYTQRLRLPRPAREPRRTIIYFPGSTIGNFEPTQAVGFLRDMARLAGAGGGALIGVDLKKDPSILHAAYNDSAGVTAEFNLNILARLNRELGGTFHLDRFDHHAFYNARRGRIEMHLLSRTRQTVHLAGTSIRFAAGERIHTESSYKYTIEEFATLAADAGLRQKQVWSDAERLFSVHYLES